MSKRIKKYRIETFGKTCHYQISNLLDNEVNDIESLVRKP